MDTSKSILVIIGTRPEAIKLCPLIKSLSLKYNVKCLCTGQHYQSVIQILNLFKIEADIIHKERKFNNISRQLSYYQNIINDFLLTSSIDLIIVHGDTTSCFAGALSAYFSKIPIAHVEAGLRTHNPYAPFPEEMYRKWTDAVATMCFAPTKLSENNLLNEGIDKQKISITGNTIVDAINYVKTISNNNLRQKNFKIQNILDQSELRFFLVTLHRNEIRENKLELIANKICEIAKEKNFKIIWPLHPNKIVRNIVKKVAQNYGNVIITKPLEYDFFIKIMEKASIIITDSGGIQEEASVLEKKLLIIREETERPEVLENASAILAGTDQSLFESLIISLLEVSLNQSFKHDIFGSGSVSEKIVFAISKYFDEK